MYTGYIYYPQNEALNEEANYVEADTLAEAEALAIADSATNCPRIVTVVDGDGQSVKGPYPLAAR